MKAQWAQARARDGIKDSAQVGVNAPTLRVGPASHRGLKGLMNRGVGVGAAPADFDLWGGASIALRNMGRG